MNAKDRPARLSALILVAAAIAWSYWPADSVMAIQDSEDMPSPISIVHGQTLQLNVTNVRSGDPIPVEIVILDDGGDPLKRSREVVMPLRTIVLTLDRDEVSGRAVNRLLTRAVVRAVGTGAAVRGLVISEEVVDNETQKTVLLHPGVSKGFNPQPDPPAVR